MIREFRQEDEAVLRDLHKINGFDYPFPDLKSDQFYKVLVLVDEDDVPVQAVAARKTIEVYFLGDPQWRTPAWRLDALKGLHVKMHGILIAAGYTDVLAFIPPKVMRAFGRRLERDFGWVKGKWQHYCRYL